MLKATATLLSALLLGTAFGYEIRISTPVDFNSIASSANAGTNYNGTTIVLDSDLDFSGVFSEQFEPIGKEYRKPFMGTFDGQGYTISNLVVNSSLSYLGLIGYSMGWVTVRNVVVDSSCSFETYNNLNGHIGGIVGTHYESNGPFLIDNCVNMANINFQKSLSSNIYLGGIIGDVKTFRTDVSIRNCVNYGSVSFKGTVRVQYAHVGGIVGEIRGTFNRSHTYVENCINYGTISSTGTANKIYIGGISGDSELADFVNCLSAGKIISKGSQTGFVGPILGYALSVTNITSSYWTSEVGGYDAPGKGNLTFNYSVPIVSDYDTLCELNANAEANLWNKWFLITDGATTSFKPNDDGKAVSIKSLFALVLDFTSPWRTLKGWIDGENPFSLTIVSADAVLTPDWDCKSFELTFNFANGTVTTSTVKFNDPISLPEVQDTASKIFVGWDKSNDKMPGEDITFFAQWMNVSDTVDVTFGTVNLIERSMKKIFKTYTQDTFDISYYVIDGVSNVITANVKFDNNAKATKFFHAVNNNMNNDIVGIEFFHKTD